MGIVGMGFVGAALYARIKGDLSALLEVAFVHDADPARLGTCHPDDVLDDLDGFAARAPDLVVEVASPEVTRKLGHAFLDFCDYIPLSVSALVDADLEQTLEDVALRSGTRLFIPHGAMVGIEGLFERSSAWEEVSVTFRKDPRHIDFSTAGERTIERTTVLVDASVREAARLFPLNLNAMVAAALASLGLDRCRGVLVAEPGLGEHIAELRARAVDGSQLEIVKRQRVAGVSGTEVPDALVHSILNVAAPGSGIRFI